MGSVLDVDMRLHNHLIMFNFIRYISMSGALPVCWLMARGIMPLYTPLGGSWLNMAESMQRILVSCALAGQHPESPAQIMAWLEAVARGWNAAPTPFEWGGKRAVRRQQARERHHRLGGSGAVIHQPVPHQGVDLNGDVQND